MEAFEASRAVFTRIQNIDPENASKIMGYILLNHGDKDMIRFAYGPETLIISIVTRARTQLNLFNNNNNTNTINTNTTNLNSPVNVSPIMSSNPIAISRPNPLSLSLNSNNSPRLSPSSSPSLWSPNALHSLSFAGSPSMDSSNNSSNFLEDNNNNPFWEEDPTPHFHRRSNSFNDSYYDETSSAVGGFKPCLYYLKGFCKNGTTCKFQHHGGNNGFDDVGSPCQFDNNNSLSAAAAAFDHQCSKEEIFRSKIAYQQRLAQLVANGVGSPYHKLGFLHNEAQRSAAAALMMGDDFYKLNRMRSPRNDFSGMGMRGDLNPACRQIYLTFPADSTFKEEDVSEYFSIYGPVQDVRIPYQQKRMFGFVTFVYSETVNLILAKGNPHFVCDSRVLVKPYKEKGKLPDKKNQHQQHMDRGDFSSCSGLECREPFDCQLGGRMFFSTQEMMLKKKIEEQALELQGRRLMNLQLMEMKSQQQNQQVMPIGSPIFSPHLSEAPSGFSAPLPSVESSQEVAEENEPAETDATEKAMSEVVDAAACESIGNVNNEDDRTLEQSKLPESFEHILPDSLFASPTKSAVEGRTSVFNPTDAMPNDGDAVTNSSSTVTSDSSAPASPPLSVAAAHTPCFFEKPRLPPGHGALEI